MDIQENMPPQSKNFSFNIFSKTDGKKENPNCEPYNYIKCVRDKFRSEGRKSDIQLKLEQKRFNFLNDGVCQKYEEEIIKFFDGFSQTKTQPKIVAKRLLESFEKAEKSRDEEVILENLKILRKITCIAKNELILQEIVLSKVMDYLDLYLEFNFMKRDQIENEIFWIYINLTTLSDKKNNSFDFSGLIVRVLKKLASICDITKIEMILWFFYNLCVDNVVYKKKLLEHGIIEYILKIWDEFLLGETCKQNLIELVLALSQQKIVYVVYYNEILKLFPILEACFQEQMPSSDMVNLLWIFKYLTDFDNNTFDKILSMSNFDMLLKFLLSDNIKIAQVSLKIINNMLSGENRHLQFLIEKNILEIFSQIIQSDSLSMRREVCFGISNICAGNKEQIDLLFHHDLLNEMIKLAFIDDISVKIEVGIAIANLSFFADKKQRLNLVNRGMIDIWSDLLSQFQNHEDTLIVRILEGLESMLILGIEIENIIGVNSIKICVENSSIPKILDSMQDNPNEKIYNICFRILDRFFNFVEYL